MSKQGPDILKNPYADDEAKDKFGERVRFSDFDASLQEVKFDAEDMKEAMYDALKGSGSNAFSFLKWKVGGKVDTIDFDFYILSQGGDAFLKQVFDRGQKALKDDFKLQKRRFSRYTDIIAGKPAAFEKVRIRDENDKLVYKTRGEVLRGSGLEARIREMAAKIGKEPQSLTFEDAFDNGFYNEYFQPTTLGVAEYGLTWLEYRNERDRANKDAVEVRQKNSPEVAEELLGGNVEPPEEPAKPEVKKVAKESDIEFKRKEQDLMMYRGILNDMITERKDDFKGVDFKLEDGGMIEVQLNGKKADIIAPAVAFYKDGKLLFAIEVKFDEKGKPLCVLRDSRAERDVEFTAVARVTNRGEMVKMLWYAERKLSHMNETEEQLHDRLAAETGDLRYYATKEEAIKAKYVVLNEDTNKWEPKEGYQFVDKRKNSTNFAIEISKDEQKDLSRYAAKILGMMQDKVASYTEKGALKLYAGGRVYRDAFGYPEVSVYQDKTEVLKVKVIKIDGDVKYRLYYGVKQFVDFEDWDEMIQRMDNLLKKNVKIDKKTVEAKEAAAQEKEALKSFEVKNMPKPYHIGVDGFKEMTEKALHGLLFEKPIFGNEGRTAYMLDTEADRGYKVQINRLASGGRDSLEAKVFVGTKREMVVPMNVRFKDVYQKGRNGAFNREDFANELRKACMDKVKDFQNSGVKVADYSFSIDEVKNGLSK